MAVGAEGDDAEVANVRRAWRCCKGQWKHLPRKGGIKKTIGMKKIKRVRDFSNGSGRHSDRGGGGEMREGIAEARGGAEKKKEQKPGRFNSKEQEWNAKFVELEVFMQAHKHDHVPCAVGCRQLALWVSHQRSMYASRRLISERARKLKSIGFHWCGAAAREQKAKVEQGGEGGERGEGLEWGVEADASEEEEGEQATESGLNMSGTNKVKVRWVKGFKGVVDEIRPGCNGGGSGGGLAGPGGWARAVVAIDGFDGFDGIDGSEGGQERGGGPIEEIWSSCGNETGDGGNSGSGKRSAEDGASRSHALEDRQMHVKEGVGVHGRAQDDHKGGRGEGTGVPKKPRSKARQATKFESPVTKRKHRHDQEQYIVELERLLLQETPEEMIQDVDFSDVMSVLMQTESLQGKDFLTKDLCLLCGSSPNKEELLFCRECGECFHTYCALNTCVCKIPKEKPPHSTTPPPASNFHTHTHKPSANTHMWRCPSCRICECNRVDHGEWHCAKCTGDLQAPEEEMDSKYVLPDQNRIIEGQIQLEDFLRDRLKILYSRCDEIERTLVSLKTTSLKTNLSDAAGAGADEDADTLASCKRFAGLVHARYLQVSAKRLTNIDVKNTVADKVQLPNALGAHEVNQLDAAVEMEEDEAQHGAVEERAEKRAVLEQLRKDLSTLEKAVDTHKYQDLKPFFKDVITMLNHHNSYYSGILKEAAVAAMPGPASRSPLTAKKMCEPLIVNVERFWAQQDQSRTVASRTAASAAFIPQIPPSADSLARQRLQQGFQQRVQQGFQQRLQAKVASTKVCCEPQHRDKHTHCPSSTSEAARAAPQAEEAAGRNSQSKFYSDFK